jgi:hypothetical protein
MELNIAKLKKQLQEQELEKAVNRLTSLKNGGPIEESTSDDSTSTVSSTEDLALAGEGTGGFLVASVLQPLLLASVDDFASEDALAEDFVSKEETEGNPTDSTGGESSNEGSSGEDGSESVSGSGSGEADSSSGDDGLAGEVIPGESDGSLEDPVTPSPIPDVSGDDFFTDDELADEFDTDPTYEPSEDFQEDLTFYDVLDEKSIPFAGTGTEEDPYIFLVSSAEESVKAMGSFLNLMAGYSADGTEILNEDGYWYQLEFHQDDMLEDTEDRTSSCIGYYLVDGSLLEEAVDPEVYIEYTLADAMTYDDLGDMGDDYSGVVGGSSSTITREEAIRNQQSRISTLKVDIEEIDINISKLERKLSNQTVYSKLDGVVSHVGSSSSSSQAYLTVKSKEGFYVQGTVSELMLDQVTEGTVLDCMSYQIGNFDATVVEVSDYPVSSSSTGFYSSDSNPNVSYYQFNASIEDQSIGLVDGDWLQITLRQEATNTNKIVLSRAFVRSENGNSYVYKEENGVLKKQYVTIAENADYGYSVVIGSGITREDYIAFPYGKTVVEGAKTQEGTASEIYGYDW